VALLPFLILLWVLDILFVYPFTCIWTFIKQRRIQRALEIRRTQITERISKAAVDRKYYSSSYETVRSVKNETTIITSIYHSLQENKPHRSWFTGSLQLLMTVMVDKFVDKYSKFRPAMWADTITYYLLKLDEDGGKERKRREKRRQEKRKQRLAIFRYKEYHRNKKYREPADEVSFSGSDINDSDVFLSSSDENLSDPLICDDHTLCTNLDPSWKAISDAYVKKRKMLIAREIKKIKRSSKCNSCCGKSVDVSEPESESSSSYSGHHRKSDSLDSLDSLPFHHVSDYGAHTMVKSLSYELSDPHASSVHPSSFALRREISYTSELHLPKSLAVPDYIQDSEGASSLVRTKKEKAASKQSSIRSAMKKEMNKRMDKHFFGHSSSPKHESTLPVDHESHSNREDVHAESFEHSRLSTLSSISADRPEESIISDPSKGNSNFIILFFSSIFKWIVTVYYSFFPRAIDDSSQFPGTRSVQHTPQLSWLLPFRKPHHYRIATLRIARVLFAESCERMRKEVQLDEQMRKLRMKKDAKLREERKRDEKRKRIKKKTRAKNDGFRSPNFHPYYTEDGISEHTSTYASKFSGFSNEESYSDESSSSEKLKEMFMLSNTEMRDEMMNMIRDMDGKHPISHLSLRAHRQNKRFVDGVLQPDGYLHDNTLVVGPLHDHPMVQVMARELGILTTVKQSNYVARGKYTRMKKEGNYDTTSMYNSFPPHTRTAPILTQPHAFSCVSA
ncbi:hypothetical protein ADUPG1_010394, partial [Aduncisulcus paluster]